MAYFPRLKIKILEAFGKDRLTVKEIADKLKLESHSIGQQLHSYRLQGLVKMIKEDKIKALHYEISERGSKRLDFFKSQKDKIMTKT